MASRAINKELKQKLESHKKWLEEQITSNENDSRGSQLFTFRSLK